MTGCVAIGQRTTLRRAILAVGYYVVHAVEDPDGLRACLALRREVFRKGMADDRDRFDDLARHVLLTDRRDGHAVACFRYRVHSSADLTQGYSAQFYDLVPLARHSGPMADLGRVAVASGRSDADLLRLLLAAMTWVAVAEKVRVVFGCSSLPGADVARHAPALAWLRANHASTLAMSARGAASCPDSILPDGRGVPPLLRCYLALGAQVGSDPVVDDQLDTVHVFTSLDLADVPAARARSLMRMMRMAEQAAG